MWLYPHGEDDREDTPPWSAAFRSLTRPAVNRSGRGSRGGSGRHGALQSVARSHTVVCSTRLASLNSMPAASQAENSRSISCSDSPPRRLRLPILDGVRNDFDCAPPPTVARGSEPPGAGPRRGGSPRPPIGVTREVRGDCDCEAGTVNARAQAGSRLLHRHHFANDTGRSLLYCRRAGCIRARCESIQQLPRAGTLAGLFVCPWGKRKPRRVAGRELFLGNCGLGVSEGATTRDSLAKSTYAARPGAARRWQH